MVVPRAWFSGSSEVHSGVWQLAESPPAQLAPGTSAVAGSSRAAAEEYFYRTFVPAFTRKHLSVKVRALSLAIEGMASATSAATATSPSGDARWTELICSVHRGPFSAPFGSRNG